MIDLLACPRCSSPLEPEAAALRCRCGAWPVVEGIPLLLPWALDRRPSLEEVLARYLPPPTTLSGKILRRIFPGTSRLHRAISDSGATFMQLAETLGRTGDLEYFRYRFSDLSFIASAAFMTPLARGPVLDLGCGAGHLLRVLSKKTPPGNLMGLDFSFPLLYLARRFLAPGAHFVCADASARLPFRDGTFEAAVCADTFNYLPDRARTASEIMRIARGPILFSHLSDPTFRGRGAQDPLRPDQYAAFFAPRNPRLYGERRLLETFLRTRTLDLSAPGARDDETISMAAGVDPRLYPDAGFFAGGSSLNPIYDVQQGENVLRLTRRFLSEKHSAACRTYPGYLPEGVEVTRAQVAARDPELVRKFVLLDLPPLYC
jgi:SAM-dependent methyltransferase/uncharacterized protein YbaR (Trm112 family)